MDALEVKSMGGMISQRACRQKRPHNCTSGVRNVPSRVATSLSTEPHKKLHFRITEQDNIHILIVYNIWCPKFLGCGILITAVLIGDAQHITSSHLTVVFLQVFFSVLVLNNYFKVWFSHEFIKGILLWPH